MEALATNDMDQLKEAVEKADAMGITRNMKEAKKKLEDAE